MTEQAGATAKGKKGRSPGYPGIDLGQALGLAKKVYDNERRNAAPVSAIVGHWGYTVSSGPGMTALSALRKFGLLIYEGTGATRKARLSDDALRILLDEREDPLERQRAIQEAALKPAIHTELLNQYAEGLPSDATLRFELQTKRGFTEVGVAEFIPQFKSTLAFAGLSEGAKLSGDEEDKSEPESEELMTPPTTIVRPSKVAIKPSDPPQPRVVQLPISASEWAALQAPFPLTEEKWNQMLAVLNAMKPALTEPVQETENKEED